MDVWKIVCGLMRTASTAAMGLYESENDTKLVAISKLDRWNKYFAQK